MLLEFDSNSGDNKKSAITHGTQSKRQKGASKLKRFTETDTWDCQKEVKELIEKTDPLGVLYNKLGYSPYVDRETERILAELKSLVRVEILGIERFDEFRNALTQLQDFYKKYPREKDELNSEERTFVKNLLNNKDDCKKIIELLNEHQIWQEHLGQYDHLFTKKGHITDKSRFLELLEKLKGIFNRGRLPLSREHYLTVLNEIDAVRNGTNNSDGSINANVLRSLEYEVESACVTLDNNKKTCDKKAALDDLLCSLANARHEYKPSDTDFMDVVREQSDTYLKSHWMHMPWLTQYLLSHLLRAEVSRFGKNPVSYKVAIAAIIGVAVLFYLNLGIFAWIWIGLLFAFEFFVLKNVQKASVLNKIYNEVSSGHYDGEELARRLQKLEKKKVFVQSITYSLLRLRQSKS